jgi:hypothetical protein
MSSTRWGCLCDPNWRINVWSRNSYLCNARLGCRAYRHRNDPIVPRQPMLLIRPLQYSPPSSTTGLPVINYLVVGAGFGGSTSSIALAKQDTVARFWSWLGPGRNFALELLPRRPNRFGSPPLRILNTRGVEGLAPGRRLTRRWPELKGFISDKMLDISHHFQQMVVLMCCKQYMNIAHARYKSL